MTSYDISLTRGESGDWIGRCDAVRGNTQASTARGALDGLRDVIALVNGLEASNVEFQSVQVGLAETDDATGLLREALQARRRLAKAETESREMTRQVVRTFSDAGVTRRDVGALLGISHQRVEQLLAT